MRKWIMLSIGLLFALAGCNLPNTASTPSGDEIATRVAFELTAMPTATQPPEPTATETQVPAPSETPTSEPTATETIAASATSIPGDPREALGDPAWKETFTNGKSFGLESEGYDDDQTTIKVENDALVLISKTAMGYHGWRTGGPKTPDNAYIEGTFQVGTCSGNDTYGLVFRSEDYINGYWFSVTCNGNYSFGYWKDNAYTQVSSGNDTQHLLLTGSNQTNRIGVKTEGDMFSFYANGQLLHQASDSTFKSGGHVGALISGAETPNFTVRLDEIAYWNLP